MVVTAALQEDQDQYSDIESKDDCGGGQVFERRELNRRSIAFCLLRFHNTSVMSNSKGLPPLASPLPNARGLLLRLIGRGAVSNDHCIA